MSITNDHDLDEMKKISWIVAETLTKMRTFSRPGMSTKMIDDFGRSILTSYGARSAPEKDYNFPGCTCISVNSVCAHGIPSHKIILREGDLINIDVSAELNGYYGDNGGSFILGEDTQNLQSLVDASKEILNIALRQIKHNQRVRYIGKIIETEARKRGFSTIRNLMGHGIGFKLHDGSYDIPNFNDKTNTQRFKKNSVIALETFISTNARYVDEKNDNWSLYATDGSFVTQHEHTLIVTDKDPIILTANNGY